MDPRKALIALSLGRVAIGLAFVLAPRQGASAWIGEAGDDDRVAVLVRALGVRDLVLGAGAALALREGGEAARPWLAASAVADSVDFAATVIARDQIPKQSVVMTIALAGGSAVACTAGALAQG
ncbi:MAG: hypothetical protein ACR2OC_13380 [Solirubrobacterales bacterium]